MNCYLFCFTIAWALFSPTGMFMLMLAMFVANITFINILPFLYPYVVHFWLSLCLTSLCVIANLAFLIRGKIPCQKDIGRLLLTTVGVAFLIWVWFKVNSLAIDSEEYVTFINLVFPSIMMLGFSLIFCYLNISILGDVEPFWLRFALSALPAMGIAIYLWLFSPIRLESDGIPDTFLLWGFNQPRFIGVCVSIFFAYMVLTILSFEDTNVPTMHIPFSIKGILSLFERKQSVPSVQQPTGIVLNLPEPNVQEV